MSNVVEVEWVKQELGSKFRVVLDCAKEVALKRSFDSFMDDGRYMSVRVLRVENLTAAGYENIWAIVMRLSIHTKGFIPDYYNFVLFMNVNGRFTGMRHQKKLRYLWELTSDGINLEI